MRLASTTFLISFGVLILFSCKEEEKVQSPIPIQEKPKSKLTDQALVNKLYQHYYSKPSSNAQKEQNAIIDYAIEKNIGMHKSPTGLYYQIENEGSGDFLKRGDKIKVNYKGYFFDGKEFDSSYKRNKPIEFKIGSMIAGWNEVLTYAKVGAVLTVCIPSRLAYGEEGFGNKIAPNTPIIFDLTILEKID